MNKQLEILHGIIAKTLRETELNLNTIVSRFNLASEIVKAIDPQLAAAKAEIESQQEEIERKDSDIRILLNRVGSERTKNEQLRRELHKIERKAINTQPDNYEQSIKDIALRANEAALNGGD